MYIHINTFKDKVLMPLIHARETTSAILMFWFVSILMLTSSSNEFAATISKYFPARVDLLTEITNFNH